MNGPTELSPDPDTIWSQDDMLQLVDSIRWFRGIGSAERNIKFIADEVPRYSLSEEMFDVLQQLQADDAIDDEILIFASDFDYNWTWRILPSPLGFAIWQNNEQGFGGTKKPAA